MSASALSSITPDPVKALKKLVVGIREFTSFLQGVESTFLFLIEEKEAAKNRETSFMHKQSKHAPTVEKASLSANCQQEPMETLNNNAKKPGVYPPMKERIVS